jgi:aminoglycoside phosphotransferase (APT) family kinase protein
VVAQTEPTPPLGWRRRFPFLELSCAEIERLIEPFAHGASVLEAMPLSGGLRNTNYRVRLSSGAEPVVLRVFSADPSACQREAALARLVGSRVPMPAVLYSAPDAATPWNLVSWVDGTRFDHLLKNAPADDIGAAARAAGGMLATIHTYRFPAAGFLDPDLSVGSLDGFSGIWSEMLEEWLLHGRSGKRLGPHLTERLLDFIHVNAERMELLKGQAHLVHADYKPWNLLVRDGQIAAVLDWEFAFSGTPLNDIGIFLRHSATLPPVYRDGFVAGYLEAGGELPADWPRLARLTDLISLCYFLERPEDDPAVLRDVRPLIETTLRDFAR